MMAGILWSRRHGAFDERERRFRMTLLQFQQPAAKQRHRIARRLRQQRLIQRARRIQIARAMPLSGALQEPIAARRGRHQAVVLSWLPVVEVGVAVEVELMPLSRLARAPPPWWWWW